MVKKNYIPLTYLPNDLSTDNKKKQQKELIKSRKQYKKGKYYSRTKIKSFKSKESPHIVKARKLYKINSIKPSKELAKKTKCSIEGLRKIVKKGQGAYYSSGSRPSQTGHSWGIARLASSITGGKASKIDYHILKQYCSKNSKALKMAQKIYPKVREKVVLSGGKVKTNKCNKNQDIEYINNPVFPKRNKSTGDLTFSNIKGKEQINEILLKYFNPNLTPQEILEMGSFGGTYFRPILSGKYSKKLKTQKLENQHCEFMPLGWFKNIDIEKMVTVPWTKYNKDVNKYVIKAGLTLEYWEKSEWMNQQDPYGWFQWYCRFYCGRRTNDDERQIDRWIKYTGVNKNGKLGRWRTRLINMCNKEEDGDGKKLVDDYSISPAIRQGLQHWAFILKKHHF